MFIIFCVANTLVARKAGHKWSTLAAGVGLCLLSLMKPLRDRQAFLCHAIKTNKKSLWRIYLLPSKLALITGYQLWFESALVWVSSLVSVINTDVSVSRMHAETNKQKKNLYCNSVVKT